MVELLKRLMTVPGISGREEKVRDLIIEEIKPYCDEINVDSMGNLIARKKGNGKKIMYCAHMDEIGFLVTYVNDDGLVRVSPIGAINALSAVYSRVVSDKGVNGVIVPDSDKELPKTDDLCIDIGAKNKKQAMTRVEIGDFFVCAPELKKLMGTRYTGRPIDDRVGCAILIEAMKKIEKTENDLYFVFSVQEEVGGRGSKPASFAISPDIGIAIDVTSIGGKPASPKVSMEVGKGCTVKIKDAGVISSPTLVKEMRAIATNGGVKYQNEILLAGGTDASSIQVAGKGARVSAISIPTAYIHTGCEMIDINDVKEAVKLVVLTATEL